MAEDSTSFDNKTMESVVVEDVSLNQSEVKQRASTDLSGRPTPVMVAVVFEKNEDTVTASEKKEGEDEGSYACVIADGERPQLAAALESLGLVVIYSQDGRKLPDHVPDECAMYFVCEDFEDEVYNYLHSRKFRIVGVPCVYSCAQRSKSLPRSIRPIYSCSMEGLVVCFTGFKDKAQLSQLCSRAHFMRASIRGDIINSAVTHIIAHSVSGSKYQVAVTRGTDIMSEDWINECWKRRDKPSVFATDPELMVHKQLPFKGLTIAFYGFSTEEEQHMKETATHNGAVNGEYGQSGVTHLVVSDNEVDPAHIPHTSSRVQVVKQKWFWESIQIDACADEQLYQAREMTHIRSRASHRHSMNTSLHSSMTSVDISALLEASIFSLSSPSSTPTLSKRDGHKRSSLVSALVSTPNSRSAGGTVVGACNVPATSSSKSDTARKHIVSELLQTERNFVDILHIIVKIFKEPLEHPIQRGGPILDNEDVKSIFGNITEILGVHEKLVESLEEQLAEWSETTCIGKVLLERAEGFVRVYPPFINFFDISKEALHKCDKTYPRFHAFLKANESRPECSRQTLAELLITPVQRIPRIILLLQDLVKHTDPKHPDYSPLEKAAESLKTVMNHINEDRRKTEGQMQMFEMLRDIEECPATLLSAQRSFVRRVDVVDMSNPSKGTKGEPISIFLFSDSMEVAKRRAGNGFTMRNSTAKLMFKHLEFIPLIHVRSVVQFRDSDSGEFSQSFGLLIRWPEDLQDKLLMFRLAGEDQNRDNLIEQIARLMADSKSSANTEQFIMTSSSEQLHSMYKSSYSSTTLKRALHGARKKVKRAFSGRQAKRAQNLTSISVHQNLDGIGEENEPMETEASNTSITSTTSNLTFTPVASLRTPKAKRPALGVMSSFSAADLTNISSETDV